MRSAASLQFTFPEVKVTLSRPWLASLARGGISAEPGSAAGRGKSVLARQETPITNARVDFSWRENSW